MGLVIVVQADAQLAEIIDALTSPRRFSRRLNRRQQQGDQDTDNRNHDQQLDQRKPA
jgi:hypothetical protein